MDYSEMDMLAKEGKRNGTTFDECVLRHYHVLHRVLMFWGVTFGET